MPPGGEEAQVDLSLRTNEVAEVTDVGGTWHRARAVLDTGARRSLGHCMLWLQS